MKWISLFVVLSPSLPAQTAAGSDPSVHSLGRISGLVLNELGQPARAFSVTALSQPPGVLVFCPSPTSTGTDMQGRFTLAGPLAPGLTIVYASNERSFYPMAQENIWDGAGVALVEATA